ncbi:caspase family protein [Methylobacterium sp. 17Sr1-1]|uniref:caspase family protein n=1 Tax=Methylobacterium sp. 17Sr1-1 TaxID=2202826 RepID=UPI0013A53FE7|nr:caspase family protein [Methylobacterium sp. 17Sr1-1]
MALVAAFILHYTAIQSWALSKEQDSAENYSRDGNIAFFSSRFEEAIRLYSYAIKSKPTFAAAYVNRGDAYAAVGRYDAALEDYKTANKLSKNEYYTKITDMYIARANELLKAKQDVLAVSLYEKALSIKPGQNDVIDKVYSLYMEKAGQASDNKEYKSALIWLNRAASLRKSEALTERLAYTELLYAEYLALSKSFDDSIEQFNHSINGSSSRPIIARALYGRSMALKNLRRYDEALTSIDNGISQNKYNIEYYIGKSDILRQSGKYIEAADACRAISAMFGTYSSVNKQIATCLYAAYNELSIFYDSRNYSILAGGLEDVTKIDKTMIPAYLLLTDVHLEQNNLSDALKVINSAIAISPNDASLLLKRARIYIKLGDFKSASIDVESASRLKLDMSASQNLEALRIDIGTNFYHGNNQVANSHAKAADSNQIEGTYAGASYNKSMLLGATLAAQGDFPQAIEKFTAALAINSSLEDAYMSRAKVYQRIGEHIKALGDFARALIIKPSLEDDIQFLKLRSASWSALQAAGAVPRQVDAKLSSLSDLGSVIHSPKQDETRVALVIGNSAYPDSVGSLDNPSRDATAIARMLRETGFKTVQLRTDLGIDAMRRTLNDFAAEADQADWAVVYYAGHGLEMNGTNYLIPTDAALKTDRAVQFEAIPLDLVLTSIGGARKLRLVILDACRDNPFLQRMTRTVATRSASGGHGLAKVDLADSGTMVAFAAKHGQQAMDGLTPQGNSPFASALIRNMSKPGVDIRRMFGMVRDDVLKATSRQQEPYTYGSLGGDEYLFKTP